MTYWGAAVPGLSMRADEIPAHEGLLRLENPGVGGAPDLPRGYALADVAEQHAARLSSLEADLEPGFVLMGMSMGSMIASIMGTTFRERLPRGTAYRLLVTSANTQEAPAVPRSLLTSWKKVKPNDLAGFEAILEPFFSFGFRQKHPQKFREYVRYRALGGNRQSASSFLGQVAASQGFDGEAFIPRLEGTQTVYVGGADDKVFGPQHSAVIRTLLPNARHIEIAGLGHMVHLEAPDLFARDWRPAE